MNAFFSGTDQREMKDKAKDGFYVMLVVNNKDYNEWDARMGFPVQIKKKVKWTQVLRNLFTGDDEETATGEENYEGVKVMSYSLEVVAEGVEEDERRIDEMSRPIHSGQVSNPLFSGRSDLMDSHDRGDIPRDLPLPSESRRRSIYGE